MSWTKETPTGPGFYKTLSDVGRTDIVEIDYWIGKLVVDVFGIHQTTDLSDYCSDIIGWEGPIQFPNSDDWEE